MARSTRTVGELAEIFDGPHATPAKISEGPWFLSISSLDRGRLVLDESAHIRDEDFVKWTRRVEPQPGDVLFSYETRLGEAALMPAGLRACLGRRMGLLRPRLDEVNPRFLLYAYLAPEFQSTIRERTISGATVDRIPLNQMSSWPITIADRASQDAIAELLGALDDKIDLNRRTSATDQQLRSAMIEVTLRDSHADVPLTELATFVNGGAFTAHATGEGRPILRIRELSSGVDKQTPRTNMAVSQDHIAEPDTLLLAWSGSVGVHRWHGEQAVINQHIFKVLPKAPTWLVEYWLDRHVSWFRSIAADKATTMGHIQRHHLDEALCVVPDTIRLHELDKAVGPLYQLEHTLANETAALGSLRDALLPELISGRMTVNPDLSVRSGGSAR